jgi:hypothetical protein
MKMADFWVAAPCNRVEVQIVGMYNCMFVCSLIARERINRFAPNLVYLFLETWKKT